MALERPAIPKIKSLFAEHRVKPEHLLPVIGCWVRRHKEQLLGEVRDHRDGTSGPQIRVRWGAGTEEWVRSWIWNRVSRSAGLCKTFLGPQLDAPSVLVE